MTTAHSGQGRHASAFTGEADELSLAQERARQTSDAESDTLEVRGDGLSILQDQFGPWQRPLRLALIAGSALRRGTADAPAPLA